MFLCIHDTCCFLCSDNTDFKVNDISKFSLCKRSVEASNIMHPMSEKSFCHLVLNRKSEFLYCEKYSEAHRSGFLMMFHSYFSFRFIFKVGVHQWP